MQIFFRVRALVDGVPEEAVCLGENAFKALKAFEQIPDRSSSEQQGKFGDHSIHIAMIHRITFGEERPIFEDVTNHIEHGDWTRASFVDCVGFLDRNRNSVR
jgi:hypothetical protein